MQKIKEIRFKMRRWTTEEIEQLSQLDEIDEKKFRKIAQNMR